MKDILLINPWIYDFTAYDFWLKPLGLLYLGSVLKKRRDVRLHLIDCLNRTHPRYRGKTRFKKDGTGAFPKQEVLKPEVLKMVPRRYSRYGIPVDLFLQEVERIPRPEAVLITCTMTYWYPGIQFVIELLRSRFGRVPVVLGGIYATLCPEHARSHCGADAVVVGPGENQILKLAQDLLGGSGSSALEFGCLEELPRPLFELMPTAETIALLTSRGCPLRCPFCASQILYPKFEKRSPASVLKEVNFFHRQFRTQHVAVYDDALLMHKEKHAVPLLKELAAARLPLFFHTPNGLHVKEIDPETAFLFKEAGFRSLFLSQETFDEAWLSRECPKVSSTDLEWALKNLNRAGYQSGDINVYLLVGLPGQDAAKVKEDILHVKRLGAKPRLAYFSPVPGTETWRSLVGHGFLREDADPLLHNKLAFPYLWPGISPADLREINMDMLIPPGKPE